MHSAVRKFIKQVRREVHSRYWLNSPFFFKNVLEAGSSNINGSPRDYFWFCKYTGVDIMAGKGVDIVGNFAEMDFTARYDVVISTEMLEHDANWCASLKKMYELLMPGGLLLITCAGPDREEHGTYRTDPHCSPVTNDYYGNLTLEEFRTVLPRRLFSTYVLQYARGCNDLQFYGVKPPFHYFNMMRNYC